MSPSNTPRLSMARSTVAERLSSQIATGTDLLDRVENAQSPDEVEARQSEFKAWDERNELILTGSFTTRAPYARYVSAKGVRVVRGATSELRALRQRTREALDALHALHHTLDLYEEAAAPSSSASSMGQRDAYLQALGELTGGRTDTEAAREQVFERAGLDSQVAEDAEDYLQNEGLIYYPTFGMVGLAHKGRVHFEGGRSLAEPQAQEVQNIVNLLGNVSDSNLQIGGANATQQVEGDTVITLLPTLVTRYREAMRGGELGLDDEARVAAEEHLETVEAQAQSSKPDRDTLARSLRGLRTIGANAAGNMAATGLIEALDKAIDLLG